MEDFYLRQTGSEVQELLDTVTENENAIEQEATTRETAVSDEATARGNADNNLQDAIDAEETARQNADGDLQDAIDDEETRAKAAEEANANAITAEIIRAKAAEEANANAITAEIIRAKAAEETNAGAIASEVTRARTAEQANADDIDDIEEKIPSQASSSNQLADKGFVNSSVATNTANYISNNGQPFASLADLQAYSDTLTNNDYAFVVGTDSAGNTTYTRYKYNSTNEAWAEEYVLNNSSFTAAQWAAISSGITSGDVTKLGNLPTKAQLDALFNAKQDTLTFDSAPTSGSTNPVTSGGVKTALNGKQDTLTFDDTPTESSSNPVKSGGVQADELVLTEGEAYLYAKIKALEKLIDNMGDLKARTIELDEVPSACGGEMILKGSGSPSVVPMFIGQFYVDYSTPALYVAKAVTNSTGNWFLV